MKALFARLEPGALAALGALQTLAFVHTWMWPLPVLSTAVLAWRLGAAATPRRAAWLGWCYGTAWLVAGTWWLFVSMHRYGGLPAWLAALAVLALAAALSLYLAAAAAAYARWRSASVWVDAPLFAALWLLAELARGVLFTGFPWVASGYSQVDAPLAALAPWVHVAVVPRRSIHVDLPEAVAALGDDPNIIWCTGPSKTADVEGILIEGVHGPGVQIALLVD